MAFDNPVMVELFDEDDKIIMPVTRPISITHNLQAFDFNYTAVQVETYDEVMKEVTERWGRKELIQYRISGRWGVETGDVNSIYAYDVGTGGEFTFYGRNHKMLMNDVLGFIDPNLNAVQRTYTATHKTYEGSALKVVRDVLADNLRDRIGVPITFQSGDLGNQVKVDFRFDEIHEHLYKDSADKGGPQLAENGNIIFDIYRDFKAHTYVLTAREPVHHDQQMLLRNGLLERWQFTMDRGEANRIIVGGPREGAKRIFGSTEGDATAPENQSVSKAERDQIESNIAALGQARKSSIANLRSASKVELQKLNRTLQKAIGEAKKTYAAAIQKADADYLAAMRKAKTDAQKSAAKSSRDSAKSIAKSTRDSAIDRANDTFKDDRKDLNAKLTTDIKTAELQYKTDVKTQRELLTTLLKQWPYPHRRFPAELYTENTSPDGIESDKLNPSDEQEAINAIPAIADVLDEFAVSKMEENGSKVDVSGSLVESEYFYLGEHIALGDYVKIGIDEDTPLGEQQIEKVVITWSRDNGYKVQINNPDETESTEAEAIKRIIAAIRDLSAKTRRR